MVGINPSATGTIAIGDIHLERQAHPAGFAGRKAQVMPPLWAEPLVGCSVRQFLSVSVVLVVIHHTAESRIAQCLHIGCDSLVRRMLIAEKPPRLHTIVIGRGLP